MDFLDTNILLYSISTDPAEAGKRDVAGGLLRRRDVALSVQVLQEFHVQATRPSRADPLPHGLAVELMESWMRFPVQPQTLEIMADALALRARSNFSYWDCAILAAARALGCRRVLTEDMDTGRRIGGLRIVDPFS